MLIFPAVITWLDRTNVYKYHFVLLLVWIIRTILRSKLQTQFIYRHISEGLFCIGCMLIHLPDQIDGLMQDCNNSSAIAMVLL